MHLPWRRVSSFTCYQCGLCCYHFMVPLKPIEAKILASLGAPLKTIAGKVYIGKEPGTQCPFLFRAGGKELCSLDLMGIKPVACKLWPIYVYERPVHGHAEEAYINYRGSFYVYFDARCPGVKRGKANLRVEETVKEAIDIWLGVRREQRLTHGLLEPVEQKAKGGPRYPLDGPPPEVLKRYLSYRG